MATDCLLFTVNHLETYFILQNLTNEHYERLRKFLENFKTLSTILNVVYANWEDSSDSIVEQCQRVFLKLMDVVKLIGIHFEKDKEILELSRAYEKKTLNTVFELEW